MEYICSMVSIREHMYPNILSMQRMHNADRLAIREKLITKDIQ